MFNIGSFVMTIDPLSIFFWVAALYSFWLALERFPDFSWHWPLTGLLIGLGFLCKYTNALQLVSVVLILALVPRFRREFRRPGLYLLLGAFVLCTIPPLLWNHEHAWATLGHLQSSGRLDRAPGLHPLEFLSFLGTHFATYSPLIALGIGWAVIASWRRTHQQFKGIFLLWIGAAGLSDLRLPLFQQSGQRQLGRARFSQPGDSGLLLLAGTHRIPAQSARVGSDRAAHRAGHEPPRA